MSLKQIINRSKILKAMNKIVDRPMDLPGEPLIYSLKYPVGQRTRGLQFFRNMQWKSFLKSTFRSFYKTTIPVVLIVRFYVTPPESVRVSSSDLRRESLPAVMSYELCDYTLSFLEMLHKVLINSYRQVVKLDVEKRYSNNPRTVMKFMKWDEYVNLTNSNTDNAKAKRVSKTKQRKSVQSKRKGHDDNHELHQGLSGQEPDAADEGAAVGCDAPSIAGSKVRRNRKTQTAKLPTLHKET